MSMQRGKTQFSSMTQPLTTLMTHSDQSRNLFNQLLQQNGKVLNMLTILLNKLN